MPAFSPYPQDPRRSATRNNPVYRPPTVPPGRVPTTTSSRSAFVPEAAVPRRPKLRMLANFMSRQGEKIGSELGFGKTTQGVTISSQDYGKGTPGGGPVPVRQPGMGRPAQPAPINPPIPGLKPDTGMRIEASPITSPWATQAGAETGFSPRDAARSVGNIIRGLGGELPSDRTAEAAFGDLELNTQPLSPAGQGAAFQPGIGAEGAGGDPRSPNAYPPGAFEVSTGPQPIAATGAPAGAPPTPGAPESATDPVQTIAQTETMRNIRENPVQAMEEEGIEINPLFSELMEEIGSPEPEGLTKEDKSRMLIEFGFSLMVSGGQPGATFLGSVGAAGLSTIKSFRDIRRERREEARAERGERRDVMGMAINIDNAARARGIDRERMETQISVADRTANAAIEAAQIRAGAERQTRLPANAAMVEYMVQSGIVSDTSEGRRTALDEVRSGKFNVGTLASRLIPGLMESNFDKSPDEIGRMAAEAAFAFTEQYSEMSGQGAAGGERELKIDDETGQPYWEYSDGRTEPFTQEQVPP